MQEVRITAHRRLPEFDPQHEGSLKRWLMRIAELTAQGMLKRYLGTAKRSANAEVTRGRRPETGEWHGSGPSPSAAAIKAEDRSLVRGVLESLSDDHRRILLLVFEEQLNLREAGVRLGRSADAARKLYGRALGEFTRRARARGARHA